MEDFISSYISYTSDTEVPAIFSRWAAITGLGAYLGRQYYLDHGHFNIHSNIYTMLIGSPGTRKGTAIKLMKKLLQEAGYTKFAAERTSKEKFLLDLAGDSSDGLLDPDELLDQNIFGASASGRADCEMFIAIDEFNDFIGNGNIEFISMLGNMWDYNGIYKNRIKTGKSVEINNPTISIIGGNTPTGFSLAFPTDILGQGFFSRLMLIYGEPNGKRIAFPRTPPTESTRRILDTLQAIRTRCQGAASISSGAEKLFEKIYVGGFGVHDVRFESYSNRRFSHLLKLALVVSAARISTSITEADIIYANTILCHTERLMPKALGEFGKAKHSDVSHKIIQLVGGASGVMTFKEIWKEVSNDLEKMGDLAVLLQNLVAAEKLQQVPGGKGFLAKRTLIEYSDSSLYNPSLLTQEERDMSI
jgi:hypothetical protein